ncbi:hypothetical protein BWR18_20850 (plasmid) [Tateyamaria omphalii]|uniref:Type II secretion system protein GspI n=2 Tax=Tateyamaria omphalii TaxID=299262 RepID=A0A1P8N288_9RHOB|nr:hypothetical protein BWR18_20850 [Tateyamaria omphalii]
MIRQDDGLTLLELVVAVLILTLGIVAVLRTTDQSRLAIGGAQDRILAQLTASNRAEEIKLLGPNALLPDEVIIGGQTFTLNAVTSVTAAGLVQFEITSRSERGPGAQRTIYVGRPLR